MGGIVMGRVGAVAGVGGSRCGEWPSGESVSGAGKIRSGGSREAEEPENLLVSDLLPS